MAPRWDSLCNLAIECVCGCFVLAVVAIIASVWWPVFRVVLTPLW